MVNQLYAVKIVAKDTLEVFLLFQKNTSIIFALIAEVNYKNRRYPPELLEGREGQETYERRKEKPTLRKLS